MDPTLPVSVDLLSYPGYPRQDTYAKYDLLGVNRYFGWYPGKFDHPTGNLEDLRPYLVNLRRQYPTAGLVLTEFGAEATMKGPATQKETYAFQADYIRRVLHIVGDLPVHERGDLLDAARVRRQARLGRRRPAQGRARATASTTRA